MHEKLDNAMRRIVCAGSHYEDGARRCDFCGVKLVIPCAEKTEHVAGCPFSVLASELASLPLPGA